jgi:5'(3')-deoxyribonucleotidase
MTPRYKDLGTPPDAFVFGVDLDNCVANYSEAFWRYLCAFRGEAADDQPLLTDYSDHTPWGLDPDEYLERHAAAVDDGLFLTLNPYPGAVDALNELSEEGVRIRVVTARFLKPGQHRRVAADTADWLDRPGRIGLPVVPSDGSRQTIPYADLMFTTTKQAITCDAFIDDSPGNVDAMRQVMPEGSVFVFDQAYNRHVAGPRVTGWEQVPDVVRELRDGKQERRSA